MADNSMDEIEGVVGGVDTHAEVHVAAVVDAVGRVLGSEAFPVSKAGYRQLLAWLRSFGEVLRVGIEGTGSYGAGLARHLERAGVEVVEVDRPNRRVRRRRGKSDPVDAEAAARAALNGEASGVPKSRDGAVESLRALRVARRSAMKARTQAANQIVGLIVTAPAPLRECLAELDGNARIGRCASFRPGPLADPVEATKRALRTLARRHEALSEEIEELDAAIVELCHSLNPALLGAIGVGADVASILLIAAGDNPERMRSDAAFAALCGASPVEASSGKIVRHRLNQGGNREANHALWRIAMVRLSCDPRTKAYRARRHSEGKSIREIVRCLKRHIAREIYRLLIDPPAVPDVAELRTARTDAGISLKTVAAALGTHPMRISRLERRVHLDTDLAIRYQHWLKATVTNTAAA